MKLKKMLSVLFAVSMLVTTLAGCGSTVSNESSVQKEETVESATSSDTVSSEVVEESPYPDYLNLDSYRPIVKEDEEVTLDIWMTRSAYHIGDVNESWFVKFVEDELNIDLNIVEVDEASLDEKKRLLFSSGELPDMLLNFKLSNSDIVQYGVEEGMLLPINQYANEELTPYLYEVLQKNPEIMSKLGTPDGNLYTLPTTSAATDEGSIMGLERIFINTDHLTEIGMTEAPKSVDEFIEMCRKYKEVYPDRYPIVSTKDYLEAYLLAAFGFTSNDGGANDGGATKATWDEADQKVVVPALTDKYADYLKVMNTLYSEELLHPDHYTMDKAEKRALMSERMNLVCGDSAPYSFDSEGWETYISAVPLTSEHNNKQISSNAYNAVGGNYCFILADTEYPELCLRFADYFYSPEGGVYSGIGPMKGSEDTLGLVEGFVYNEESNSTQWEVPSGYENERVYRISKVIMCENLPKATGNSRVWYEQNIENYGLNVKLLKDRYMENGDYHYRYLVHLATYDHIVTPLPAAYMSVDDIADYTDLNTVISDYVNTQEAKFVTGLRSLDEIDQYYAELEGMGGPEYEALILDVYENYKR